MNEEAIEQIKVCEFLRQCTDIPFIHIANERATSPTKGAMLKRMGVRAGVSDLFLPRKNNENSGLWIELKSELGRASVAQMNFIKEMKAEGYSAEVCYGAQEAIDLIKSFYGIE